MNKQARQDLAAQLAKQALDARAALYARVIATGSLNKSAGLDDVTQGFREWYAGQSPEAQNALLGAAVGGTGTGLASLATGGNALRDTALGAGLGGLAFGGGTAAMRAVQGKKTIFDPIAEAIGGKTPSEENARTVNDKIKPKSWGEYIYGKAVTPEGAGAAGGGTVGLLGMRGLHRASVLNTAAKNLNQSQSKLVDALNSLLRTEGTNEVVVARRNLLNAAGEVGAGRAGLTFGGRVRGGLGSMGHANRAGVEELKRVLANALNDSSSNRLMNFNGNAVSGGETAAHKLLKELELESKRTLPTIRGGGGRRISLEPHAPPGSWQRRLFERVPRARNLTGAPGSTVRNNMGGWLSKRFKNTKLGILLALAGGGALAANQYKKPMYEALFGKEDS